jgi:hypothetical protein
MGFFGVKLTQNLNFNTTVQGMRQTRNLTEFWRGNFLESSHFEDQE